MVNHLHRRLSKRGVCIITEGHDASVGDLLGEEIFQPERLQLRACPGSEGIAVEAVDSHDTKVSLRLTGN